MHRFRSCVVGIGVVCIGCGTSSAPAGAPPIESDGAIDVLGDGVNDVDAEVPVSTVDPCRGLELPDTTTFVAGDLCVRAVGRADRLRQITFAPNGDLFGVSITGDIIRFRDQNHDGTFDRSEPETVVWASTGGNGNDCALDTSGGYLYAGTPQGVARWAWTQDGPAGAREDVVTGEPSDGNHPLHTVHVFDGYLWVHSGSHDNDDAPASPAYDTNRSALKRFALSKLGGAPISWGEGEVVAVGLRNMVGYGRDASGRVVGVVNGMDDVHYQGVDVHQDNPGEQLVRLEVGARYGFPFCFTAERIVVGGVLVAPGTQLANDDWRAVHDDAWCAANSQQPLSFFQAHSAPLDIAFFDGDLPRGALPDRFRGGAFVTFHGSWDRATSTGFKVVFVPFDASGNVTMPTSTAASTSFPYETIFGGRGADGGARDGAWTWSSASDGESPRPVGVAVSPVDGALYVSSDADGYVYRIGGKP